MKLLLKKLLALNQNEETRIKWVRDTLAAIPAGSRLLDAGAGEQRYRPFCGHLRYVAQDFGQYDGTGDTEGLQTGSWNYAGVHIVSDIANIPEPDASFDAIICTEVLEHVPDPLSALDEFARLLKPGGQLILTAPFAAMVHFSPYFFSTGFSRYWYELHLPARGFTVRELTANGDWFDFVYQEVWRLLFVARRESIVFAVLLLPFCLPLVLVMRSFRLLLVRPGSTADIAVLGYHCVATKS